MNQAIIIKIQNGIILVQFIVIAVMIVVYFVSLLGLTQFTVLATCAGVNPDKAAMGLDNDMTCQIALT